MSTAEAFREERHGRVWIMYAPAFAAAVDALGLREPEATRALLAIDRDAASRSDHAAGRAPGRRLLATEHADPLHFRRALHGGLLAPLWRDGLAGVARVRAELEATRRLRALGAPVPEAAFGLAFRRGALWEAGVATVFEPDALDGLAFLARAPDSTTLVRAAEAVGRAIRAFHDLGGRHPDLHLGNLLVRQRATGIDALVIDLDRVALGASATKRRRRRELSRLERSLHKRGLHDRLTADARAAFCVAYAQDVAKQRDRLAS